jgi:hypothetical protein
MMQLHFPQACDFMWFPESAVRVKVVLLPESCVNWVGKLSA